MKTWAALWCGWLAWAASAGGCSSGDVADAADASSQGADATVGDAAGPGACGGGNRVDDGGPGGADAGAAIGDYGYLADGSCYLPPASETDPLPPWQMNGCPDGGCPSGQTCVHSAGHVDYGCPTCVHSSGKVDYGCAPIPPACGGTPSCACMGCVCPSHCGEDVGELTCFIGTVSRRAFKDDIAYVDDEEREALARQALDIPLARYRYKNELPGARRRLGFIIDDQPDTSPAVLADRTHVDEYGYTSMLLATVQQQAKELRALRQRVDALEVAPK